mmetsp:Transcript_2733/g.10465  ORF Transcript_2733/g.10465 Transcript_2733/m.10465 type:complete len:222 (-) Transcript_2733:8-673(-)
MVSDRLRPRRRQNSHGSLGFGFSGPCFSCIAHTLGAAGSMTISETLIVTVSSILSYKAPRTTFVPQDSATDTRTAYSLLAGARSAFAKTANNEVCVFGKPHPIALSMSAPVTRRHLGAKALYRASAGKALARSITVAKLFTAASGASKNTAPVGALGSEEAARTLATKNSGTPGSARAASNAAAAVVASAASSAGVGIVRIRRIRASPRRGKPVGVRRVSD